jgi:hypothetical protein
MDVKSLCRTDSIMTNVLAREAWNIALHGTESVALSKWPRYSNVDKYKSLSWSINRRVALKGIKLWKVVYTVGNAYSDDVGMQFVALSTQPKFVDIAVMLVESRSIDANMEIVAGGYTPLYVASHHGHLPVVEALLQAGADVDKARDNGATPLYIASHHGHLPVVQALLQAGTDVDKARDDGGATPLIAASNQGNLPVVQALLQTGADVDKAADDGCTPLYVGSQQGHVPVVQALLQVGADVDEAANDHTTPLYIATHQGYTDTVHLLPRGFPAGPICPLRSPRPTGSSIVHSGY